MRVYQIGGNIIHIHYSSKQDLYNAGNRFHVFYEHPDMKGSFQEDGGDWEGYNFPPQFLTSINEDFSQSEQELYSVASKYPDSYFILTYENPEMPRTLIHETAHALYTTNTFYKNAINLKLQNANLTSLNKVLGNYDSDVFDDEAQAYLIEWHKLSSKLVGVGETPDQYLQLHLDLERIYNQHAANLRRILLQ